LFCFIALVGALLVGALSFLQTLPLMTRMVLFSLTLVPLGSLLVSFHLFFSRSWA
jgi:hypothetical protein